MVWLMYIIDLFIGPYVRISEGKTTSDPIFLLLLLFYLCLLGRGMSPELKTLFWPYDEIHITHL